MKEPTRMCETDELPRALREAFGTLGREAPSAETALRVQRTLQALPKAVPAATAGATLGLGKLLVLATLIAGALTSAVVLKSRPLSPRAAEPASVISPAAAPAPRATAPETQTTELVPARSERAREPVKPRATQPAEDPARQAAASPQVTGSRQAAASPIPVPSPSGRGLGRGAQRAQHPRSAAQRALAEDHTPDSRQAEPTPEQTPPSPAAQTPVTPQPAAARDVAQVSEAQRLAQCKQIAQRDPAEALRQVEALAQEVPYGALVQERELLAIRLHERLGHSATAQELARRFLERYPNSVYRRALMP
jgi:hypothetical protein